MSYSVFNYWGKRKSYINTDFSVTGWMLCVITHIRNYSSDDSYSDHRKQVNNVVKKLFHGLYEYALHFKLYLFWNY